MNIWKWSNEFRFIIFDVWKLVMSEVCLIISLYVLNRIHHFKKAWLSLNQNFCTNISKQLDFMLLKVTLLITFLPCLCDPNYIRLNVIFPTVDFSSRANLLHLSFALYQVPRFALYLIEINLPIFVQNNLCKTKLQLLIILLIEIHSYCCISG